MGSSPTPGVVDEKRCCTEAELQEPKIKGKRKCRCALKFTNPHFVQLKEVLQTGESHPFFARPTCKDSKPVLCGSEQDPKCAVVEKWINENPLIADDEEEEEEEEFEEEEEE